MTEAARNEPVIEMKAYLRDTLEQIDHTIAEMAQRRHDIAVRLAVIEASEDPAIIGAADDYARRVEQDAPYEDAAPAAEVLGEAFKRYCANT